MRPRPQRWSLHPDPETGTVTVARGNRAVAAGLNPLDAQKLVSGALRPGERVFEAAPDGYLTEVTRRFVGSPPDRVRTKADPVRGPAGPSKTEAEARHGWPRHEWPRREWPRHGR
jgi:hypothetical protein